MIRVVTKSGSIYEVDTVGKRIRAAKRCATHRIELAWKPYEAVDISIGQSMSIYWGTGRDSYSPDDGIPDENRNRYTITSRVVSIEDVESEAA